MSEETWIPFKGKVASEKDGVLELVPFYDEHISMYIGVDDTKIEADEIFVKVGGHFLKIDVKPSSVSSIPGRDTPTKIVTTKCSCP